MPSPENLPIEWKPGKRESVDGRWWINKGVMREGRRQVIEYYLMDGDRNGVSRSRAVCNTPAEAREYAQQIVDKEARAHA